MSTSRRGFLKACGAVVAGALIIPEFRLIEPDQPLFDGECLISAVRESCSYSLHYQAILFRYEIIGPDNQQMFVDGMLSDGPLTALNLEQVRTSAAAQLQRAMRARGWRAKDLRQWEDRERFQVMAQRENGEIFLFGQSSTELWT